MTVASGHPNASGARSCGGSPRRRTCRRLVWLAFIALTMDCGGPSGGSNGSVVELTCPRSVDAYCSTATALCVRTLSLVAVGASFCDSLHSPTRLGFQVVHCNENQVAIVTLPTPGTGTVYLYSAEDSAPELTLSAVVSHSTPPAPTDTCVAGPSDEKYDVTCFDQAERGPVNAFVCNPSPPAPPDAASDVQVDAGAESSSGTHTLSDATTE